MNAPDKTKGSIAPALTLMLLAPLAAEILPGSTRFSALFVLPIEICVWGGGALLIRYAVRRRRLGGIQMLFLAIALAIAEECLIQQTSLAPLVIQLKGQIYARVWGLNYVYFLWALIYEPVFAVLLPVYLTELIFPERKNAPWMTRSGLFAVIPLFLVGAGLAWYTWTQIARVKVFHLPAYHPPVVAIVVASVAIASLVVAALAPSRLQRARRSAPARKPPLLLMSGAGLVWAVLLYALVLLAFGIAPAFPSWIAIVAGLVLAAAPLYLVPRWASHPAWESRDDFALILGTMLGSMMISFVGFIGAARADLLFKIIMDALAVAGMILLGIRIRAQQPSGALG